MSSLRLCQSQEIIKISNELFSTKWQYERYFCDYFKNGWLNKYPGWYQGYSDKYQSTNKALESYKNEIKRRKTLGERYPLSKFKIVALNIVENWSKERDIAQLNVK